jgi:hypothetical protein
MSLCRHELRINPDGLRQDATSQQPRRFSLASACAVPHVVRESQALEAPKVAELTDLPGVWMKWQK